MSFLTYLLPHLVYLLPGVLFDVVGIIVAVRWQRRAPTPAHLVLAAFAILLLTAIGGTVGQTWLMMERQAGSGNMERFTLASSMLSFATMLMHTLGMGLLLWAAFADRGDRTRPT